MYSCIIFHWFALLQIKLLLEDVVWCGVYLREMNWRDELFLF